jgi:hypothetical protein
VLTRDVYHHPAGFKGIWVIEQTAGELKGYYASGKL